MTLTLRGDDFAVEQMEKQLYRLIDVLKVQDLPQAGVIEHELALIKVRATNHNRSEIIKIVELYKGRILDVSGDALVVEHSGPEQEIDSLIALMGGFGIKELVRTGAVAMLRGSNAIEHRQHPEGRRRAGTPRGGSELMGARMYYDNDADPGALAGPDGRRHRLRLPGPRPCPQPQGVGRRGRGRPAPRVAAPRDGRRRPGSGAESRDAVRGADVVMILVPDTAQKALYDAEIAPNLRPGAADVRPRLQHPLRADRSAGGVDVGMVAPKGPGHLVRRVYVEGGGVPALVRGPPRRVRNGARAHARLRPRHRRDAAGVLETTFAEETETDLFGEQAVLCGGVDALVKDGLRDAGGGGLPAGARLLRDACTS